MEKEREVYVIKATKGKDSNILKVAAYCRVSTDSEDQINSFVEQIRYYNDFIRSRGDMVLVDIYADEGITGTSVNKRDEFNRMMKDSKAGKIDRVFVKSVSRFARNSLECIENIRLLKSYGTSVFFENDGIDTDTMNSEMILYIKSAFAQEEALAGSRRVRRANQMRMESGKVSFTNTPFGYDYVDKTLIPIPEEAEIVRKIYRYYLEGMGFSKIAQLLNSEPNIPGKPWGIVRIRYILSNEKYIGDTLNQKTYTPLELPLKNIRNDGEVDKYYVTNTHEAIIDKKMFFDVQEMIRRNHQKDSLKNKPQNYTFTQKLFCGDCNWAFKKRVQNGIVYWACSQSGVAGQRCFTHILSEEIIMRTFCNMYNKLRYYEDDILKSILNRLVDMKSKMTNSKSEIVEIDAELIKLAEKNKYTIELYQSKMLDEGTYITRVNDTEKRIKELRSKRVRLIENDDDEKCIDELRSVVEALEDMPKAIVLFDEEIFSKIIKKVIIEENSLLFILKCGLPLREVIAWD